VVVVVGATVVVGAGVVGAGVGGGAADVEVVGVLVGGGGTTAPLRVSVTRSIAPEK
jgi:hypothetical protein